MPLRQRLARARQRLEMNPRCYCRCRPPRPRQEASLCCCVGKQVQDYFHIWKFCPLGKWNRPWFVDQRNSPRVRPRCLCQRRIQTSDRRPSLNKMRRGWRRRANHLAQEDNFWRTGLARQCPTTRKVSYCCWQLFHFVFPTMAIQVHRLRCWRHWHRTCSATSIQGRRCLLNHCGPCQRRAVCERCWKWRQNFP